MNRRCTIDDFISGAVFHIYNRTLSPLKLFYNNNDYEWLLNQLIQTKKQIPSTIFSYCLMPNHFHFLIRQDGDIPVYKLFNIIFSAYARHLNHKLKRKGPIFEDKLQHIKIIDEKYLIQLAMYIHNNPVKAGIVSNPANWNYSNYNNFISKSPDKITSSEAMKVFEAYFDDYQYNMESYSAEIDDRIKHIFIDYEPLKESQHPHSTRKERRDDESKSNRE